MPPSCAELGSPRARSGSFSWAFEPAVDGLLPRRLDEEQQEEMCTCAKAFEEDADTLGDQDEEEASRRLRALSVHEMTCAVCQRSQVYYRASARVIQRRRSVSTCEAVLPVVDEQWELEYRSTGWWMLCVVVALLATFCAFVHPEELSVAPTPSLVAAKPSMFSYLLHGGEPTLLTEYEPSRKTIREFLHRAHVAIHSAVRGRHTHEAAPSSSPSDVSDAVAAHVAEFSQSELVMDIYCRGPLLHAVQMAGLFSDSKHFVDMPIKANSSAFDVLVDFQRRELSLTAFAPSQHHESHASALRAFLDDHFDAPGSDLLPVTPFDYVETVTPPLLAAIRDPQLRQWAEALHHLWRSLGRVPHPHVQSSLLQAKPLDAEPLRRSQNVLIVPGGRFRESYYWDSYWIVHGLLASGMRVTARGVVNNLLEYVAEFGFVPNGGRVYYLTRSQPPMLSEMVKIVAETDGEGSPLDLDYLRATVPILEREYAFWMTRGPNGHAVELEWRSGNATATLVLNRYTSGADQPRPESYREDVEVAAELFDQAVHGDKYEQAEEPVTDEESDDSDDMEAEEAEEAGQTPASTVQARKQQYYNDVIAATESGWDFSSRWLREPLDMKTMITSAVLPADLNAVLFRMERNLEHFHALLGNASRSAFFREAAGARQVAMDRVLWSERDMSWRDFDLSTRSHSKIVSVSDYAPLWAGAFDREDKQRVAGIVASLKASGLVQVGGVQSTTTFSGQQWDAPNAWSPSQDMLVEGLLLADTSEAAAMAKDVAQTWVRAGLAAFQRTGLMFEKYNASEVGGLGVGGEYFPQFGFGWSNGVVLKFLTRYQHLLED